MEPSYININDKAIGDYKKWDWMASAVSLVMSMQVNKTVPECECVIACDCPHCLNFSTAAGMVCAKQQSPR